MSNYVNLDFIKSKWIDAHRSTWSERKDFYNLEKTIDMDARRYYFVSVWKDADHKERIGVIIFGQHLAPNKLGYMVEHFSIFNEYHDVSDTLNFKSDAEVKALSKIVGKITKREVHIKWIKFDDIAPGFKRCDKC